MSKLNIYKGLKIRKFIYIIFSFIFISSYSFSSSNNDEKIIWDPINEAHQAGYLGENLTIMVIDVGFDLGHPAYKYDLIPTNFTKNSLICSSVINNQEYYKNIFKDEFEKQYKKLKSRTDHGTEMLKIIHKIAPEAKIITVDLDVFEDEDLSKKLFEFVKTNKIDAVSMSIGNRISMDEDEYHIATDKDIKLIESLTILDIPFFHASGNDGEYFTGFNNNLNYFAKKIMNSKINNLYTLIGAAEVSEFLPDGIIAYYSARPGSCDIPFICAPVCIAKSLFETEFTGTSCACAYAAGCYLLTKSASEKFNLNHTNKEIFNILINSTKKNKYDATNFGKGVIRIKKAFKTIKKLSQSIIDSEDEGSYESDDEGSWMSSV